MRTVRRDHLHLTLEYDHTLGFYHWEKKRKQKVIVDLKIEFDVKKAAKSDHLKDTIDYDVVDALVLNVLKRKHYNLIETIAEEVAREILALKGVHGVDVSVDKPLAIPHARKVSVSIYRKK
ncbi:MAG: dihydroneopterin aldolase [Deltaproteobacteria bacterium]|nr:dihydroneopterin aldolase [Deltaproteobacteria bacterium]